MTLNKITIEMSINEAEWVRSWLLRVKQVIPQKRKHEFLPIYRLSDKLDSAFKALNYGSDIPDYNPDHF